MCKTVVGFCLGNILLRLDCFLAVIKNIISKCYCSLANMSSCRNYLLPKCGQSVTSSVNEKLRTKLTVPNIQVDSFHAPQQPKNPGKKYIEILHLALLELAFGISDQSPVMLKMSLQDETSFVNLFYHSSSIESRVEFSCSLLTGNKYLQQLYQVHLLSNINIY